MRKPAEAQPRSPIRGLEKNVTREQQNAAANTAMKVMTVALKAKRAIRSDAFILSESYYGDTSIHFLRVDHAEVAT